MPAKREDYHERREQQEKRNLEHLTRRWPTNPNVYYVALVIVLLVVLLLSL